MSLFDEQLVNPAKRRLELKEGKVTYYDKEAQENVEVDTPLEFAVLDTLATVTGWSDEDTSGFWSNEVRSVGKDTLNIRTSKGAKGSGIWSEIKGQPSLVGAKYATVVYLAHETESGIEIAKMSMSGAALNAWIEFTQKNNIKGNKVILSGFTEEKKGRVEYFMPVFEAKPFAEGEKENYRASHESLQEYLNGYLAARPAEDKGDQPSDVAPEDIDDGPIDLSGIPF